MSPSYEVARTMLADAESDAEIDYAIRACAEALVRELVLSAVTDE